MRRRLEVKGKCISEDRGLSSTEMHQERQMINVNKKMYERQGQKVNRKNVLMKPE